MFLSLFELCFHCNHCGMLPHLECLNRIRRGVFFGALVSFLHLIIRFLLLGKDGSKHKHKEERTQERKKYSRPLLYVLEQPTIPI